MTISGSKTGLIRTNAWIGWYESYENDNEIVVYKSVGIWNDRICEDLDVNSTVEAAGKLLGFS